MLVLSQMVQISPSSEQKGSVILIGKQIPTVLQWNYTQANHNVKGENERET